jgi:hypothetical protein
MVVTWRISVVPARRTGSVSASLVPNDSITALGPYWSTRSTVAGSAAQLSNPTPQGLSVLPVRMESSRSSHSAFP